ncbi:hypothetical protein GCM10010398_34130 [Streptomyces fimbriatus]
MDAHGRRTGGDGFEAHVEIVFARLPRCPGPERAEVAGLDRPAPVSPELVEWKTGQGWCAPGRVKGGARDRDQSRRVPPAVRVTGRPVRAERSAATPVRTLRSPSRYPARWPGPVPPLFHPAVRTRRQTDPE